MNGEEVQQSVTMEMVYISNFTKTTSWSGHSGVDESSVLYAGELKT